MIRLCESYGMIHVQHLMKKGNQHKVQVDDSNIN